MTSKRFALILLALIVCLSSAIFPARARGEMLGSIEGSAIAEVDVPAPATPSASPSAAAPAASPAATSSPAASHGVGSGPAQSVSEILHPSQWQFPHNFSLTDPDTWPFIPVPEIATDPNGGTTVGVLAAVLFNDQNHQITNIFAPDVETNTTLGPGGTFRFLSYPSEDTQWYAVAGPQEKIARKGDIDYPT